jgi:solute carrier family 5 (sodium-coupled monocarboxylate transporter), member 8/12
LKNVKEAFILNRLFLSIAAALSSLSSGLNSLSALALEDYFKPMFKKDLSEKASGYIMRGTVIVIGILSLALVYVVEHLGPVLQLSMSLPATCVGSVFGVFIIGMFLPWIGKKAAFYGALIAAFLMIYWVARAQIDSARGLIHLATKPTSVDGCLYNFTFVEKPTEVAPVDGLDEKFHISYLYYMPMGAIITCISAFILSFIFGFEDPSSVDPRLLAPVIRKYFPSKIFQEVKENNDGSEIIIVNFEMKKNQIE